MKDSELLLRLNIVLNAISWWPKSHLAKEITSCKVEYRSDIGTDQYNMNFDFIREDGAEDYLVCQIMTDHQGKYCLYYEGFHTSANFNKKQLKSLGYDDAQLKKNYYCSSGPEYPASKIWYSMTKDRWEQGHMPGSVKRSVPYTKPEATGA